MSHRQSHECRLLRKDPVSVSAVVVTLVLVEEENRVPVLGSASASYIVRNHNLNVKEHKEDSDTGQDWCCRSAMGLDLGVAVDSIALSVECFLCLSSQNKMIAAGVLDLVAPGGSMIDYQFATDPAIVVVAAVEYLAEAAAVVVAPGSERLAGSTAV
jgi:hypothetical protein